MKISKMINVSIKDPMGTEFIYPNVFTIEYKNTYLLLRGYDYDCEPYKVKIKTKNIDYIKFYED